MNRKAKNIIIKGLLLVLVVAFVTLLIIAKAKRERLFSSNVEIKINHLNGNYFVDQQTIFNNIKRRFPVNQKIGSDIKRNEKIGEGVFAELIQQFLCLRVVMPVALKLADDVIGILKKSVCYPFQLCLLGEFGKTVN